MAKGKNDPTSGNDYINQLNWRANRRRYIPVRFMPKWKYKVVYRFPPTTFFTRILHMVMAVGAPSLIIYMILSGKSGDSLGERIALSVIFGLIFIVLFFAIKDNSKDQKDDPEDSAK